MAALECVKRIDLFNDSVSLPYDLNLGIRIGISSGDLLVGNVGSEHQLNYTFVGDDINLSARLEGINKIYGTQILINGETRKLCSDDLVFREIDTVKVVGRNTPTVIFEPLGRRGVIPTELMEISEAFRKDLNITGKEILRRPKLYLKNYKTLMLSPKSSSQERKLISKTHLLTTGMACMCWTANRPRHFTTRPSYST